MGDGFFLLATVVLLALAFDYINGFHDTANAIATVVSTNVLPARTAIMMAALFNFGGAFIGVGVAKTIGGGIADPTSITQTVVAAALAGAIVWNLITWYFGLPSSSSHALVGGLIGSVMVQRMLAPVMPEMVQDHSFSGNLWTLLTAPGVKKVIEGLIVSPIAGLLLGFFVMVLLLWLCRRAAPTKINKHFKRLQLVSAAFMALSHGSNDAQKAMGIITMALVCYYSGNPESVPTWLNLGAWQSNKDLIVPTWVIVACATAMALGTASGGWRIMKTMGHKIIKLKPINGFAAETAGSIVILTASALHAPVSTTHVISSSIMGVGASKRASAVRWGVAGNILIAWVLTIPISALVAAICYLILRPFVGA